MMIPAIKDYEELAKECKALAQPFIDQVVELYRICQIPILCDPNRPELIPTAMLPEVGHIQLKMKAVIEDHIQKWHERWNQ